MFIFNHDITINREGIINLGVVSPQNDSGMPAACHYHFQIFLLVSAGCQDLLAQSLTAARTYRKTKYK